MAKAKHTPGPWVVAVAHDGKQFMIIGDDGEAEVALVLPHRELERLTANVHQASEDEKQNARLIAAAPELLAVAICEEALEMPALEGDKILEKYGWSHADRFDLPATKFVANMRKATIRKAHGETIATAAA